MNKTFIFLRSPAGFCTRIPSSTQLLKPLLGSHSLLTYVKCSSWTIWCVIGILMERSDWQSSNEKPARDYSTSIHWYFLLNPGYRTDLLLICFHFEWMWTSFYQSRWSNYIKWQLRIPLLYHLNSSTMYPSHPWWEIKSAYSYINCMFRMFSYRPQASDI